MDPADSTAKKTKNERKCFKYAPSTGRLCVFLVAPTGGRLNPFFFSSSGLVFATVSAEKQESVIELTEVERETERESHSHSRLFGTMNAPLRPPVAMATAQHCDTEVEDVQMHGRHGGSDAGGNKSGRCDSPPFVLPLLSNS